MTLDELKDHFAGQYVAGAAAAQRLRRQSAYDQDLRDIAREAYDLADALCKERNERLIKRQKPNAT